MKRKGKSGSAAKGGTGDAKINRKAKFSPAQPKPAKRIGNASNNPDRPLPVSKKAGFYRDKAKINLLNMYNSKPDLEKMRIEPTKPVRIQPDRRWFGNTRVITQTRLEQFRESMEKARKDPYSVVLKRSKLPVSLFSPDGSNSLSRKVGDMKERMPRVDLLSLEPFAKTFGRKQLRKKPKFQHEDLSDLAADADQKQSTYIESSDGSAVRDMMDPRDSVREEIYKKGTSRRIWQELYKVVDSSDVIVQIIDARDPMGTRCKHLEAHLRKDRPNKHLVLLMNKCDLVPAWCSSRQYASLLKDRKHVSVGFIGYPNVGKSSVINTLRKKKVCKAAPVPGETKVWQYVALTHRVYLIDCPGVVPSDGDAKDDTAKVLKGVVRAERIEQPEQHIPEVLKRVLRKDIMKRYELGEDLVWESAEEFLTILARKMGKLLKGGEPDISTVARGVIYDWQRGRIPFFVAPPRAHEELESEPPLLASDHPIDDDIKGNEELGVN